MNWLSNNKKYLFGNIDFKDPMNNKRFDKNVKTMSYFDWIWFNPAAFKIIYIGRYFLTIFIIAIFFGGRINNLILKVLVSLYIIFLFYKGVKAFILYRGKDVNFYDLYIREYD